MSSVLEDVTDLVQLVLALLWVVNCRLVAVVKEVTSCD